MTSNWHAVLIKCRYEPRIIPILLALLRIIICLIPQTGYLHPDEFFQSPEIISQKYFNSKINPVWEFKTDKPIRCMLLPSILNTIAFKLANLLQAEPSAYMLLVAPRLIYTLLSFVIDASLYKLTRYYSSRGLWYLPISVVFQSSFICLGCLTRTLSNTPEVVIYSLLLVVVCQTLRPSFRILFVTPTRSTPVNECIKSSTQLTSSLLVGTLITLGTFNRPTFPCFAIVPMIYWMVQSLKRNSYNARLTIQRVVLPITTSATITAVAISAYDTLYYRGPAIFEELFNHLVDKNYDKFYSQLFSEWVLTPHNFISYNTNVNNLAKYGLHVPYTHILVNVPLAFNLLGFMFYSKLIQLSLGSGIYRLIFSTHRIYALMLLSTITSIILLSFIPHQEFRFLLPLIVPLVYAFAFDIYSSNKLLSIWLLTNAILIFFYTSIHQSGVVRASLDLDGILKSHAIENEDLTQVNVVALRCYLVPSYYWNIHRDDYRFKFDTQDTFVNFNSSVNLKVGSIIRKQQDNPLYSYKIFIMLPRIYEKELIEYLESHFSLTSANLITIKNYLMHFSGEEFWDSVRYIQNRTYTGWSVAFGFSLLQLNLNS